MEDLIELNKRLIYSIALKFKGENKEDLYQAGVLGLIKAYRHYQEDKSVKFSTYAYKYIFGEMYEYINNNRQIKVNKDMINLYKKIEMVREKMTQVRGYIPSDREIAGFLNINENIIISLYKVMDNVISLDNDNNYYNLVPIKDNVEEKIDINDSLKRLNNLERDIIKYRYYGDYSQSEVGKILGLSQVTVSRYEKKSLCKMYNYLKN